jgi:uncharacterized LabA/DUF88 family protein
MKSSKNDNLAVLIDADNAQASIMHALLTEVSRYGTASVKRAYGDWTTDRLKQWKKVLHKLAIQPMQQFSYTTGKNSTDSALIIDAMDLLHTGDLNGFCIVSSDSDFTRLATRLREAGLAVYGFGERKTPQAFVAACDKFIYSDILTSPKASVAKITPKTEALDPMIRAAIEAAAQDDGWANLGQVGSTLQKNSPSFDPRNYGYQKLGELIRKQSNLKFKEVPHESGSGHTTLFVRMK